MRIEWEGNGVLGWNCRSDLTGVNSKGHELGRKASWFLGLVLESLV